MARQENFDLPSTLPVFGDGELVLFPGTVAAVEVEEEQAKEARERMERHGGLVLSAFPEGEGLRKIGCAARITQVGKNDQGAPVVVLEGLVRVAVAEVTSQEPLVARVLALPKGGPALQAAAKVEALAHEAKRLSREILAMLSGVPPEVGMQIQSLTDPGALADLLAFRVPGEPMEKQEALEALDLEARLGLVVKLLSRRRGMLEVNSRIDGAVREEMGRAEREHVLRRKLRAIEKELSALKGEPEDDGKNGADALQKVLDALPLPTETRAQVNKELRRLASMPAQGSEVSVARTWLQWIADLPWGKLTADDLDVGRAQATLDKDHRGLEKVKKRVTQYLAVRLLKNDMKGPILCLVGPPGVGKTSLGQSIARSMGRKFVRVSLGGVRDEAEIRGHRRTYVGALPGRLIQALKRAGTANPVVMLDEIDKLALGNQGDPAAALLEVLDPEQNHAFADHYLEVPFDLSKVLFIATANTLDTIASPLQDRMEILEIPSYTTDEKVEIARTHLLPKQVEAHGLAGVPFTIGDAALLRVVTGYTREAGVRGLEKKIAEICRAVAVDHASGKLSPEGQSPDQAVRVVSEGELEGILGPDLFVPEALDRTGLSGVATGLAWTPVGGMVLFIEATQMPGSGKVILSGQLGEVMRESAQAAISYVKAHAAALGLPPEPLADKDLHIHFPAGGTPKDGPSAGVTIFTALVSLLTDIKVRGDVAMTGEATLRGKVLPVGGVKEKVLAAHRLGIRRVILPVRCKADLADVPDSVKRELEFVFADTMEEVLEAALERSPLQKKAAQVAEPEPAPVVARGP
jgi:ATP-dependent Lon protease